MPRKGNESMKRSILLVTLLFACTLIAGCGCQHDWTEATCQAPRTCSLCQETEGEVLPHQWQEATCAAPKTCNTCGETEGESLPHAWVEANYQEPKTCSVCSESIGTPLTADYSKYGFKTIVPQKGNEYEYITTCYQDTSKKTSTILSIDEYYTVSHIESTSTPENGLPYKEGYEWKVIHFSIKLYDQNGYSYGASYSCSMDDYYQSYKQDASTDTSFEHVVNYRGCEYTVTSKILHNSFSQRKNGEAFFDLHLAFHMPVGYDGKVIGFIDASNGEAGKFVYEMADENTLFFRLT